MAFAEIEAYGDADRSAPVTSVEVRGTEGKAGWYVSNPELVLNAADDLAGVKETRVKIGDDEWAAYKDPLRLEDGVHDIRYFSIDASGNAEEAKRLSVSVDSAPPSLAGEVAPRKDELGGEFTASAHAADPLSGIAVAECEQPDPFTPGFQRVLCRAEDQAGNVSETQAAYQVVYPFGGFLPPLRDEGEPRRAIAGRAIPVAFSLGGDRGLGILADGYPVSFDPAQSEPEPVSIDVNGQLTYDAKEERYGLVWKTDRAWSGTTRRLTIRLIDGSEHAIDVAFN
nr:PxKF domain-containing protein [Paenibacillus methanolicus]